VYVSKSFAGLALKALAYAVSALFPATLVSTSASVITLIYGYNAELPASATKNGTKSA
tara:strand:+ start:419 stop:592 length:174 start_codon:yes stop_codon:yes gene_type:complete